MLVKEIFSELMTNKWLIYQLFKRDFFATYKQSFFGVFWAFLLPFVSMGTFIILNMSGIFSIGDIKIPYPIYALVGLTFWNIFSSGITSSADSLVRTGEMLTKINFSKKSLVFASLGSTLISLLLQTGVVIVLFCVYRLHPHSTAIYAPLIIIPLLLLTAGLGLYLSVFNVITRDIGRFIPMLVTFMMLLTPVLYEKPKIGILMRITRYNPFYYFIASARDLTFKGHLSEPTGLWISCALAVWVFLVSLITFHIAETRITERI
jgi:lipopolysaccharide transport system permease protein